MSAIKPMVDANILIYAHNQDSPFYPQAKSLLAELITTSGLSVSSLVLNEFFSVITDGRKIEKPIDPEQALSIINDFNNSQNIDVLSAAESDFFSWIERFISNIKRYQIYDAFIAYTMFQNGITQLYTKNTKDFKEFDFLQAIDPFPSLQIPDLGSRTSEIIPYARQSISEQDIAAVCKVLRSDWLTQGPKVPAFERAVADKVGVKHAVAVNSGTSGLHVACLSLGLGPGDILWTSPTTFVASANCALYCGAKVDFVDIDFATLTMCPKALEEKLEQAKKENSLPKIVIPVHMCGQPCNMAAIFDLSQKYGFKIIEDACHALGGEYKGSPIGSCRFSDITVFSFHPVKIITTGEGGMAVTNDVELSNRMSRFRSHGITSTRDQMEPRPADEIWNYQQIDLGYNYRMIDIQAALGLSQLEKLDVFIARRREIAQRYEPLLTGLPIIIPWQNPDGLSAWHLYVIRLQLDKIKLSQKQVFEELREKGIGVNLHYIPVHTQPWYQKLGFKIGQFPKSEQYFREAITLPLFPAMKNSQQDIVVRVLQDVIGF